MKSPILGSSYVARSVNAADNRMANPFSTVLPQNIKCTPASVTKLGGRAFWINDVRAL